MLNIFHGIHTGPLPPLADEEKQLSENLRRHVEMLASIIGDRNVINHPKKLDLAASFIESDLTKLGYQTASQPYVVMKANVRNIDTELRGSSNPDEIIVVGAHYDSVAI